MFFTNLFLALSLAVDAFAVSVALGIQHRKVITLWWMVGIALSFGFFQSAMPLIGWGAGAAILGSIQRFDFWVSFVLLFAVGVNMMRNARGDEDTHSQIPLRVKTVAILGVATSIDALAVGFTLSSITQYPLVTIAMIGIVTASLCFIGLIAAHRIPKKFSAPAELFAGFVLVLLGCKILAFGLF